MSHKTDRQVARMSDHFGFVLYALGVRPPNIGWSWRFTYLVHSNFHCDEDLA